MDSLDSLDKSLDSLEDVLAPLLSTSLSETVTKLDLLQKAKLQVLLPYVVNDLVFIYLKTRGINPKTHPVIGELDRVKQYFDKIKNADDPEKRRFAVDQGAATRFIKHAIKESQAAQEQTQHEMRQGTHTRFTEATVTVPSASAAALAKIQARDTANQREESDSEESELEVFDESLEGMSVSGVATRTKGKGKGKEKETVEAPVGKKRRRGIDPWTGYDESRVDDHLPTQGTPGAQKRKKAKGNNELSSSASSSSPPVEADSGMTVRDGQMTTQPPIMGKAKKKKGKGTEVIDVDALSESSDVKANTPDNVKNPTSQIIDIDAMDSSRSGTPVQGKSKGKKRRKSNA